MSPDRDPREVFADWLITPKNPWFTRSIVNRVWAWLLGRGIIHEPDDIRDGQPAQQSRVAGLPGKGTVASHYDLKHLYRLILNSQTYQLSSMPAGGSDGAGAARPISAAIPLRRLDAEVLIDAINKITGTSDLYTSPIPEPFTYIPGDKPAIAIADGSITSPFLALFGRSARATGMENERNNKPVPAQWLHMLNSSHIQRKLDQGPKLKAIFESGRKPAGDHRRALPDDPFPSAHARRGGDAPWSTAGQFLADGRMPPVAKPAGRRSPGSASKPAGNGLKVQRPRLDAASSSDE